MTEHSATSGYLISIDTLNPSGAETSKYAAHLLSNLTAAMAIGDLPVRPTFTARVGEIFAEHPSDADEPANPDTEGDYRMDHYDAHAHDEARNRLSVALAGGAIAIMDEVYVGADRFLRTMGKSLDLGGLLATASRIPDLALYLNIPDSQVPRDQWELHEQFHHLAAAHPDRVVVIEFSAKHQDMCDAVWHEVSTRLRQHLR